VQGGVVLTSNSMCAAVLLSWADGDMTDRVKREKRIRSLLEKDIR